MRHTAEGTSEEHRHWSGGRGEGEKCEQNFPTCALWRNSEMGQAALERSLGDFKCLRL